MGKVLIIDDEKQILSLLSRIIGLEGYDVFQAVSCKAGIKQLEQNDPEVVLCDVCLPDGSGVELVTELKRLRPLSEVILLTAHGNIPDGVQAIKNGAFDYITKGDDNNKILPLIAKAMEKATAAYQQQKTAGTAVGKQYSFATVIGRSPAIQEAVSLARKVAATDVPVLLTGETGTGKEVFAQSIHQYSSRSDKTFVAINCSSFSRDLLESEMFGHKAGAFTGALKETKGLFEEADNGTIFLDEIGEMAFDLQAKLLRILETGEFLKIGDTKPIKVNVRVIAATNRDLAKEIADANAEGESLGLTAEELAFYDALTKPQAIKDFYEHDELIAITKELTRLGSGVKIVADEWCNTYQDIVDFTDAGSCHMVQIKTPDLGGIHNIVDAVLYCNKHAMEAYQGGTCNETEISARTCVHVALAARPMRMLIKPGMGFDEGLNIVFNEMNRTIALLQTKD